LDTLIRADGPAKDNALGGILCGSFDKPVPVADCFGGDENSFSVPAVDDIAKPLSFFAD
jgi:hypothetical protein